jgi:hypothetical protein
MEDGNMIIDYEKIKKKAASQHYELLEYRRWCARFTIDDTLITQP